MLSKYINNQKNFFRLLVYKLRYKYKNLRFYSFKFFLFLIYENRYL